MTYPTELVTLDEVMAHLNLEDDSNLDLLKLQTFIDAATTFIQNVTGPILPQEFTEIHDGGQAVIVLYNPPVLEVTSVVEYVAATGYTLTAAELGQPSGAYSYSLDDPKAGVLRRRYNGGLVGRFAGGQRNIAVTYTAGQATVPADIRMAVLQDIAGMFQPSQLGANPYYNDQATGNGPLNPIGMFPRVAAILSDASKRAPVIA